MSRIMVVGCVSVLLSMGAMLDLAAHADETKTEMSASAPGAEESFCIEVASEFPVSQDRCVECVNAGDSGAQCFCESISEKDMRADGRLENPAQCVKMFRHLLESEQATD